MRPELTPLENDALSEAFNIGMGRAASVLSTMAQEQVNVSIPKISIIHSNEVTQATQADTENVISSVDQEFTGDFSGAAVLMFPSDQSLSLVQMLIQNDLPAEMIKELESDALREIGNVILNACFGTVINLFNLEVEVSTPNVNENNALTKFINKGTWCLHMQVHFSLPQKQVDGHVSFFMDFDSISSFIGGVQNFISPAMKH